MKKFSLYCPKCKQETFDEASEFFDIGEKELRQIASENLDSGFVIQNGVKVLIKRKRFETFLEELSAIRKNNA